jgi:four helix bundle protein
MFPKHELFGLTSQVRRSAASIPANIAEGCGRGSVPELTRFMRISMGSATELEYHLLLGHDLCLLSENEYQQLNAALYEVKCMLAKYIQRLEAEG